MRHYLQYGLAAAILFAVSASVSLWLQNKNQLGEGKETPRPFARIDRQEAALPSPNQSEREKALRDKEEMLQKRQEKLDLIQQDVRNERAALDELRKQLHDQLHEIGGKASGADAHVHEGDKPHGSSARDEEEIRKHLVATEGAGSDRAKAAALYENMAPEKAASMLQQMAANSSPEDAVTVLAQMKEDTAELVLAMVSSSDAKLSAQLRARLQATRSGGSTAVPVPPVPPEPVPPIPPVSVPPGSVLPTIKALAAMRRKFGFFV